MRKYTLAFAAFLLAACGDTIENQMGMDVVDSVADLPKCTSSNEGEQAFVKGEPTVRVCVDGEWFATAGDASGFSCNTEELKDGSGLKIICNGDSIGVVLNGEKGDSGKDGKNGKDGEDGEDGKAGTGCAISGYTEATVTVVCGDSTMVLELGAGAGSDTLVLDSEKVAVSFESLAGYSQKGPFLKGSTVYLYELSDGRTLKQTNGNFTSIITRDDGRYKFTARDLVSQYAMIVVDGNYRNEVTGKSSEAPIRLRAITDMRKRSDANINLLTHLEFDRVYYLVTREKKTVKQAKKQAQNEIFKAFHIEIDENADAEDLDVFGKTDADAALLAISVLLQGDGNATDLSVLLTEIADDMETDGKWDGPNSAANRARIADWAIKADSAGRMDSIRHNVKGWGLSDTVPIFEKYMRVFYEQEYDLGLCGGKDNSIGTVKHIGNRKSVYYAESYFDSKRIRRFVCKADGRWDFATDFEKDTYGWRDSTVGAIKHGSITGKSYVYTNEGWRYFADSFDLFDGKNPYVRFKIGQEPRQVYFRYYDTSNDETTAFVWPAELEYDWDRILSSEIIDKCGGICGEVHLGAETSLKSAIYFSTSTTTYIDGKYVEHPVDVSSWGGLCVMYTSDIPITLRMVPGGAASFNYSELDLPFVTLPKSSANNFACYEWNSFKPKFDAITGDSVAKSLNAIQFIFEGDDGTSGSFNIKRMSTISGLATVTNAAQTVSFPSNVSCGDLWCGPKMELFVNTKMDDDSYGYWFDSTDAAEGGRSRIQYSQDGAWNLSLRDDIGDIVGRCDGICGSLTIEGGNINWPWAYVGFSMSEDGVSAKDISSWKGVCVVYKSDVQFSLEMGLSAEMESKGYVGPNATIPATASIAMIDLPWENFHNSAWDAQILVEEAVQQIASLRFVAIGQTGVKEPQGDFAIYSIGRLGTCGL